MAYNFLSLTNEICGRLNETKLNSSNFANAINFYSTIKDSLNAAIRDINHQEGPADMPDLTMPSPISVSSSLNLTMKKNRFLHFKMMKSLHLMHIILMVSQCGKWRTLLVNV